ncbi:hypothetical protein [Pyrobaculum ferrireducens]|uniref:EamA domain-containing protein n=1 Tax=Pyrobaculum ferrireducens TaxID=1104324 RepID=G7VHU7_9CREN|nr:hypothetical protein P186_0668 [Pyrobaculum ferrireducens]
MGVLALAFSVISAVAYGVAPLIYRPALQCTSQYRAVGLFSLYSIVLGFLLPWRGFDPRGVLSAVSAALLGGVVGSWLYVTSVKAGGAAVGNISSSLYIVLLPLVAGHYRLLPAALLVLLGLVVASAHSSGARRGGAYGVAAAVAWTASISLYASAVDLLGPGGALLTRGVVVFFATLLLGAGGGVCRVGRLILGGFVDTFVGFGAYTLAVSIGDYVTVSLVTSSYPLITALFERPFMWRRAAGASIAVLGLALVALIG